MSNTSTLRTPSPATAARSADAYVGRRAVNAELREKPAVSVHGDLTVLRTLAARQNATRRIGSGRRTHGRSQGW